MNIEDFVLTKHAIDRALDMGIEPFEIRECLLRPERVNRSRKYPGRINYSYGRVGCTVAPDLAVVTIQWTNSEAWRADLSIGTYGGRDYRDTDFETGAKQ